MTKQYAAVLLDEHYGIRGEITSLSSERDLNFRVAPDEGARGPFVFKVYPASIMIEEAEMRASILSFLESCDPSLPVPRLLPTRQGRPHASFVDEDGAERHAIAYDFLIGMPLFSVERVPDQSAQCGRILARLAIALKGFSHPLMEKALIWDLRQFHLLRPVVSQIADLPFSGFIKGFLDFQESEIGGRLDAVPRQFVHNDFNARNIIVNPDKPSRVTGVIDFGDAIHTARIADVAIGVIGQITDLKRADDFMGTFVDAYHASNALTLAEHDLLPVLVAGRIVQNVVMTSWYRHQDPGNEHFSGFGPSYFEERVEFARLLVDRWKAQEREKIDVYR